MRTGYAFVLKSLAMSITPPPSCLLCHGSSFLRVGGTDHTQYEVQDVMVTDNRYGRVGPLWRCRDCGMVSVHPRPAASNLEGLYAEMSDPLYLEEAPARTHAFRRILNRTKSIVGSLPALWLDVGSYCGLFQDAALACGSLAEGVEPSRWAASVARAKGHTVHEGPFPKALPEGLSYNALTALDVIEHVDDPRGFLMAANAALRPAGLLVLVTPDIESPTSKLLGAKWWHLRPAHVHFFSRSTISRLLKECGFEVLSIKRYTWCFSLRYWISRLEGLKPVRAFLTWAGGVPALAKLLKMPVSINFLDSLEIYARKAEMKA